MGNLTLTLSLLSPARRPIQITQDLGAFWQGSYKEVQKEMKGRYPKHPYQMILQMRSQLDKQKSDDECEIT